MSACAIASERGDRATQPRTRHSARISPRPRTSRRRNRLDRPVRWARREVSSLRIAVMPGKIAVVSADQFAILASSTPTRRQRAKRL